MRIHPRKIQAFTSVIQDAFSLFLAYNSLLFPGKFTEMEKKNNVHEVLVT